MYNATGVARSDELRIIIITSQICSSLQFYRALPQVSAHRLAVQPTTLLFWFLADFFSEIALKAHCTVLPAQHQTADRHSYRLAGEHSWAFSC